jgi:hypothetical protein
MIIFKIIFGHEISYYYVKVWTLIVLDYIFETSIQALKKIAKLLIIMMDACFWILYTHYVNLNYFTCFHMHQCVALGITCYCLFTHAMSMSCHISAMCPHVSAMSFFHVSMHTKLFLISAHPHTFTSTLQIATHKIWKLNWWQYEKSIFIKFWCHFHRLNDVI